MSAELIKFAFVAGEVSPRFFNRSDLEKFDLGLALARNVFVDYRGGLSNRAGTEFLDYLDGPTKFFRFALAPEVEDTYLLVFGNEYVRFVQDGGYVLEAAKTISVTGSAVTSVDHGYSNGDWIKINGRTYAVAGASADAFNLEDIWGDAATATGATSAQRIYTISSPYNVAALEELKAVQTFNRVVLTHKDFAPRHLTRNDVTDWALVEAPIGNDEAVVTGLNKTSGASGTASTVFAVTAVLRNGIETRASARLITQDHVNYTTTQGHVIIRWTPRTDALYYNVYRGLVHSTATPSNRGAQLGYLGRAYGAEFTDNNIIPDFTKTPPIHSNPFAPGKIEHINVVNGGTGRSKTAGMTVTGSGSGFSGFAVIGDLGAVEAFVIENGGSGYVNPTVSVAGGSGGTFTAEVGPTTGTYPRLSAIFQQRLLYGSSLNQPLTIWASRPGQFNNFDVSTIISEADSYEFDLDAEQLTPILHFVSTRSGLLIMTATGIWNLSGGQEDAVTPLNALADVNSYSGVSFASPIRIDIDLLYVEQSGTSVRLLTYNEFSRLYSGINVSILSNHLFDTRRQLETWTSAEAPYNLIYAIRTDGALLTFTVVKEQEVFAWTQNWTRGYFLDVMAMRENSEDRVYFAVERRLQGRTVRMLERQASREFFSVEDAWFSDCALRFPVNHPAAEITLSAAEGVVTVTASAAVFSAGNVGDILRVGGGRGEVTDFVSTTEIEVTLSRPVTEFLPESEVLLPFPADTWTLDTPSATISGLWHLEGESVAILADGSVEEELVVENGEITLQHGVTRAIVGLPFRAVAGSLPVTVSGATIEGRRKRVIGVAGRRLESRGIKTGPSLDRLVEQKDRTTEPYGEPTRLQDGIKYQMIPTKWDEDGQIFMVQEYPLPMTILGYVLDVDIGDGDEN